jgi:hypothetical protein
MGWTRRLALTAVAGLVAATLAPSTATGQHPSGPEAAGLTTFSAPGCEGGCGSRSTVGPDRTLYVTDGPAGRVLRIDPRSVSTRTYPSGLPPPLVGPSFGETNAVEGIYRVRLDGSVPPVIVPAGQAGSLPPLPANRRVLRLREDGSPREVAAGAPPSPDTGSPVRVTHGGGSRRWSMVLTGRRQLRIGRNAHVVTSTGKVLKIRDAVGGHLHH